MTDAAAPLKSWAVAGTARPVNAIGVHEPFAVEIDGTDADDASDRARRYLADCGFEHVLIHTVRRLPRQVARWATTSGKHWVELTERDEGYYYDSPTASGYLGVAASCDEDAVDEIQRRVDQGGIFQPDSHKKNMSIVPYPARKR